MRFWHLLHMQEVKGQMSLCKCEDLSDPSLLSNTKLGRRIKVHARM